jgi:uncharacterized Zn-binding protein involved in type VI secretion
MPAVTRYEDADIPHCSGMTRLGKSSDVFINGRGVSRQSDVNTSHLLPGSPCPSHGAPISSGSSVTFANGLGVGRIGDGISGCTAVAAGSGDTFDQG